MEIGVKKKEPEVHAKGGAGIKKTRNNTKEKRG